jgi:5'-methylthioadenosine phosphorylase
MSKIGIIGGSGLYQLEGLKIIKEVSLSTPYGKPSDKFVISKLYDKEVIFLPRHGKHHKISPTNINYRANIYGMKKLGVEYLISVTACGSLKEELRPLDFVIPTQYLDRTNQARKQTFFDEEMVVHISFAYPVCENLAKNLKLAAEKAGVRSHYGQIYLNMEGPQFSTLAESNLYRSWGIDIIGMTNMAEAKLAREAEICYATLAAVTDYDCWHQDHAKVTVDIVLANLNRNVENSQKILKNFISQFNTAKDCSCKHALKNAIVTSPKFIPQRTKDKLKIIIGKYIA